MRRGKNRPKPPSKRGNRAGHPIRESAPPSDEIVVQVMAAARIAAEARAAEAARAMAISGPPTPEEDRAGMIRLLLEKAKAKAADEERRLGLGEIRPVKLPTGFVEGLVDEPEPSYPIEADRDPAIELVGKVRSGEVALSFFLEVLIVELSPDYTLACLQVAMELASCRYESQDERAKCWRWEQALGYFRNHPPTQLQAYEMYLSSPKWQSTRDAAVKRASGKCQVCNGVESLNVHHRTYERLGWEFDEDLIVLCRTCHRIFHENGRLASP